MLLAFFGETKEISLCRYLILEKEIIMKLNIRLKQNKKGKISAKEFGY